MINKEDVIMQDIDTKNTNDSIDERIKTILANTNRGLTKDSVAAIICLEDEIARDQTLIKLIKKGDIIATYEGDKTVPYVSDKFLLKTKNDMLREEK